MVTDDEATTDSATNRSAFEHVTVLRDEVCLAIAPRDGGLYLDLTLGGGGHTEAILEACGPSGRVIGIDRDPRARVAAAARLQRFGDRLTIVDARMSAARSVLDSLGISQVNGVIADLGISSPQIDDPSRGMSFRSDGPLDMRMDTSRGETAAELIDRLDEKELADLLFTLGDERASRPISRAILRARDEGKLLRTGDLAAAVYRVLGPKRFGKNKSADPATRTFQALRIAVNDELGELEAMLASLPNMLTMGGIAAIISFHSLEDRQVKWAFREDPSLVPLTKKPIDPSESEQLRNPRSRSAHLRVARRVDALLSEDDR
ncbi:MAG: 16S rRNA (cytosine(1402)-N(4))-methyltransferase RsmH [Deltaproteobacteria bacterium]|nr:16S rRNA (cytosine(1402)-N(4))-methyltransferase RsmH [Deltaproteobacteria bacterium]